MRPQVFDAHVTVLERTLERLPGLGVDERLAHRQHQVAAVGPLERPRLDHDKVGGDRTHKGVMLNAANEIVIGGIALDDDGRAPGVGMVNQHVHLVTAERRRVDRLGHARLWLARALCIISKVVNVGDNVRLHRVHVSDHLGEPGVFLAHLVNQMPDDAQRRLFVQQLQILAHGLFHVAQAAQAALDHSF